MKRLAITTLILSALLPAGTANSEPFLRLGTAEVGHVCPVATNETYLVQPRPWQPGDPNPIAFARVPLPDCNAPIYEPLVVNRARRLTISPPYPGALQMGAAWFSGGERRTLFVQPIGGPPAQKWHVWLPMQSGRLLVHQWGPPKPSIEGEARGGVVQPRTDWKVSIRRQPGVVRPRRAA